MEKKRKKMPVKSRLRVLYRVCALVCAVTVALAVPMVAGATGIKDGQQYISFVNDIPNVNINITNDEMSFYLSDLEWNLIAYEPMVVGKYYNFSRPVSVGIILQSNLPISVLLNDAQRYLISHSVDTTITVTQTVDVFSDPSFSSNGFVGQVLFSYDDDNTHTDYRNYVNMSGQPNGLVSEINLGDFFYGHDSFGIGLNLFTYLYSSQDRLYDIQYMLSELNVVIRTVGSDYSTADIVINLGKLEDSINQGFDQMGDKLDGVQGSINQGFDQIGDQIGGVQEDINSGFDEVGGKLDNIQSDINTGLDNVTGAINGSSADTSGMDNGMAQLGGQLGNLGDVEEQLGGLIMDKVEVPDLILTNDQGSALALLVSCLNLAYVDLKDYQVMFASVMFFGIVGVLLFGRRNL